MDDANQDALLQNLIANAKLQDLQLKELSQTVAYALALLEGNQYVRADPSAV